MYKVFVDKPVKRPRHLMDPDNLVRPVNDRRLTNVQRWVFSVLTVFTIAHLVVGILIASVEVSQLSGKIGLSVISGLFAIIAIVAGQAIHRRNPLNAWLLLALVPTAVGIWLALR